VRKTSAIPGAGTLTSQVPDEQGTVSMLSVPVGMPFDCRAGPQVWPAQSKPNLEETDSALRYLRQRDSATALEQAESRKQYSLDFDARNYGRHLDVHRRIAGATLIVHVVEEHYTRRRTVLVNAVGRCVLARAEIKHLRFVGRAESLGNHNRGVVWRTDGPSCARPDGVSRGGSSERLWVDVIFVS
jgi:hypothetical protein